MNAFCGEHFSSQRFFFENVSTSFYFRQLLATSCQLEKVCGGKHFYFCRWSFYGWAETGSPGFLWSGPERLVRKNSNWCQCLPTVANRSESSDFEKSGLVFKPQLPATRRDEPQLTMEGM